MAEIAVNRLRGQNWGQRCPINRTVNPAPVRGHGAFAPLFGGVLNFQHTPDFGEPQRGQK